MNQNDIMIYLKQYPQEWFCANELVLNINPESNRKLVVRKLMQLHKYGFLDIKEVKDENGYHWNYYFKVKTNETERKGLQELINVREISEIK